MRLKFKERFAYHKTYPYFDVVMHKENEKWLDYQFVPLDLMNMI